MESQSNSPTKPAKASATATRRAKSQVDPRLVKAMAHPIRNEALSILNERVASPNEIAQELGVDVNHIAYHVRELKRYECIELVDTKPRRGAMEHFYRATARAYFDDSEWGWLPQSIREGMSGNVLQSIMLDASDALKKGSLDARVDRHLSWTPMILDEEGWEEVRDLLSEALDGVLEAQARSAGRLAERGEEGTSVTVAMLGFEAAGGPKKRPAPAR